MAKSMRGGFTDEVRGKGYPAAPGGFKKCKTMNDLRGIDRTIKKLINGSVEQMLQCEMTKHLRYEKHARKAEIAATVGTGSVRKIVGLAI
jgi:hypothetical protein